MLSARVSPAPLFGCWVWARHTHQHACMCACVSLFLPNAPSDPPFMCPFIHLLSVFSEVIDKRGNRHLVSVSSLYATYPCFYTCVCVCVCVCVWCHCPAAFPSRDSTCPRPGVVSGHPWWCCLTYDSPYVSAQHKPVYSTMKIEHFTRRLIS